MLRRILIPTLSDEYKQSSKIYREEYDGILEEKKNYAKSLAQVLEAALKDRLQILHEATTQLSCPTPTVTTPPIRTQQPLKNVRDSVEHCSFLRAHIEEVNKDIETFESAIACQTTLDMTGYHDLTDWAKKMSNTYSGLTNSLITLSLAGAAIVYATIFSAVHGDIGLMAFTFPLFCIGFLIPAAIQITLSWASNQPTTPFASQLFWRIAIGIFMVFSTLSVAAAITILNITVFSLRKDSETLTDDVPRIAGILAFAFSGTLFVLFAVAIVLSMIARGPKKFILGSIHLNRDEKGWGLKNYNHVC